MKNQLKHLKLFLPFFIIITAFSGITQQQHVTHVASKGNKGCNGDCTLLEIPQLENNPKAIIFVTPLNEKPPNLNPHPICVYYFKGKWYIMNLDQAAIADGSTFNVEYFTSADQDHFQYLIKKENLQRDGTALIDHPALNNNPSAQFNLFHSWVPEVKEYASREEIKVQYNPEPGKWSVSNVNKKALMANIAYNINISDRGKPMTTTTNPVTTNPVNTNPAAAATGNSGSGPISGLLYMTVWVNGVKLPGESTQAGHLDQVEVIDYEMIATTARELASGRATGRRQYEPFTIKKLTGGLATIPYFNAFVLSQELVVSIDAYSITSLGTVELNYTIKLTGAHIAGFKQTFETPNSSHPMGYVDVVKFSFTKIEYIKAGVSVGDAF